MGIRYYYKNGKTGFQTSGGCHLTKACWDEAWLLDDTDRALVRDSEGYALLRIRSGEAILDSPFRPLVRRQIRRLARSIERRRYRTLHTTMPLPRKVFLAASTQYWLRYGQRFGTSRRQMETMQIEA